MLEIDQLVWNLDLFDNLKLSLNIKSVKMSSVFFFFLTDGLTVLISVVISLCWAQTSFYFVLIYFNHLYTANLCPLLHFHRFLLVDFVYNRGQSLLLLAVSYISNTTTKEPFKSHSSMHAQQLLLWELGMCIKI